MSFVDDLKNGKYSRKEKEQQTEQEKESYVNTFIDVIQASAIFAQNEGRSDVRGYFVYGYPD